MRAESLTELRLPEGSRGNRPRKTGNVLNSSLATPEGNDHMTQKGFSLIKSHWKPVGIKLKYLNGVRIS